MTDNPETPDQQDPAIAADPSPAPEAKTFTQEDVDRVVKDRLARERAKYDGFDDLKKKASEFDKLEAEKKSELEKAQERATELERQIAEATRKADENALRSAIVAEAARKKVVDPDAAFALVDRSSLVLDDSNTPTNIGEVIDALLEAKPYLAGTRAQGSADLGARGKSAAGQLTRDDLKTMTPAQIIEAQDKGLLNSVLGVAT